MNEHKEKLEKHLHLQKCPCSDCECRDIGIDNWGMFEGERDWFYYCKDCDITFPLVIVKEEC